MHLCLNPAQRITALPRAAAQRAQQVPAKVEQAGPRGQQAQLQRLAPRFFPKIGQGIGPEAE